MLSDDLPVTHANSPAPHQLAKSSRDPGPVSGVTDHGLGSRTAVRIWHTSLKGLGPSGMSIW